MLNKLIYSSILLKQDKMTQSSVKNYFEDKQKIASDYFSHEIKLLSASGAFTLIDTDTWTETCNNSTSIQKFHVSTVDIFYPCLYSSGIRCVLVSLLVSVNKKLIAMADVCNNKYKIVIISNNRSTHSSGLVSLASGKSWIRHWVGHGRCCFDNLCHTTSPCAVARTGLGAVYLSD